MQFRAGSTNDTDAVLALFDANIAWLVERGRSAQWGSEPWTGNPKLETFVRDLLGDGVVTIEVQPHGFFTRDGDDVRLDLPITLDEAVRGGKVKVPTVDGAVMLTIAPGSSSGKVLRRLLKDIP